MSKSKRKLEKTKIGVDEPLPTRQRRSAETTERLLEAAEGILRHEGIDAATLRAIADRAGVSIGIVYRRFRDKDAVLRAVYTRFFARTRAGNRRALDGAPLQTATTTAVLTAIVRGIAEGYSRHRDLLRPLVLYVRTHPDPAFRRRARLLNAAVYADVRRLLLESKPDIDHPDPEAAVAFGVSAVASVLQERILFKDVTALPSMPDPELIGEATRMLRCYLCGPSRRKASANA
jgi:AcrR family transcriptional regulator